MKRFMCCIALALLTPAAFAQSADDIVKKMEAKLFTNGKSWLTLVFTDENGEKESYTMNAFARDRNQRTIVRFLSPARVVGNDLLMLERNVWVYDAKTDRVIKVPSNLSFGGTGFSYGDVVRLNYSDNYLPAIVESRKEGGWILDLSVKERDAPYFRIRLEIDASFRPVKGVCYGKSGDVVKEMAFSNIKDAGGGSKPLSVTVTSPLEPGRVSVLTITKEVPKDYPESIFNKRNLSARLEEQY